MKWHLCPSMVFECVFATLSCNCVSIQAELLVPWESNRWLPLCPASRVLDVDFREHVYGQTLARNSQGPPLFPSIQRNELSSSHLAWIPAAED